MSTKEITHEMYKVFSNYHQANNELIDKWQELILYTPRWWLGLFLGFIPWFIWWRFHHKDHTGDLLRAGFFMGLVSLFLDSIGVQRGLWIYSFDVFPFIPGYIPWDLTLLPITMMIMIEFKQKWHPLWKGIMYAGFSSFIGEPLAVYIKLYEPLHWKSYYSFPIYVLLFVICHKIAKGKVFNSRL
ncbi:hypothetical protein FZW96_00295 [Bacillus sp. BGMRC 2118]|nr:hypothetical protein FZW96_00295 [Bacillus sp. BGMRC 2118]